MFDVCLCWHFVNCFEDVKDVMLYMLLSFIIYYIYYYLILRMVCVFSLIVCMAPLLWHNMCFGKRGAERKARHLCYLNPNEQVNFTDSLLRFFFFTRIPPPPKKKVFLCSLLGFMLSASKREKHMIRLTSRSSNTTNGPKVARSEKWQDSEYNTIYDVLKSRGWKETDVDNEWHIFWILGCIWHGEKWHEVGFGWWLKSA